MDIRKVLFIGGDAQKQASVQIRCVDIAPRLGADYLLNVASPDEIPRGYQVYVCVKANLGSNKLQILAKKGKIVWDIIDALPPADSVFLYIASTKFVQKNFSQYGRVEHIPHHHCNLSLQFNPRRNRKPGWVGQSRWSPALDGCKIDYYFTDGLTQTKVIQVLRKIGIGVNFRGMSNLNNLYGEARLKYNLHMVLNSGIKLINCIGFGIPSVSADEPAYREIDGEFTIFCDRENCGKWIDELQNNHALYHKLRDNCMERAREFHVSNIVAQYKSVLSAL